MAIVLLCLLAAAGGYFVGIRTALPFPITGFFAGVKPTHAEWRKGLPPLQLEAKGTVEPQTGAILINTVLISTDPVNGMTADLGIDGTLEKPRWTLRSLKKKNVRLEIRL